MADPLTMTLAASAVSILTPFIKKGIETFSEEFGKAAAESTTKSRTI